MAVTSGCSYATPFRQTCKGYLVSDNFGLHLAKNADGDSFEGVTWCDATIDDQRRVLQNCSIGRPCFIEGTVQGHVTFNWVTIDSLH